MVDAKNTELIETPDTEAEPDKNAGLDKALETYRKLIEKKVGKDETLSEKEQDKLENKIIKIFINL